MAAQPVGRFLLAAGLVLAFHAHADFSGKVVAVADGDTITVLHDKVQVKVRLTEIDAPEKKQAFGNGAKFSHGLPHPPVNQNHTSNLYLPFL